ncbi:hypothetical protein K435DRAFT_880528 [Dendrothele bispora CBS 962.96]|uniref:Uncharacterized protein n=1 Tax=Dendrothele bispora (strain CBS 962.96) TaxID=1314807 RepID=A0A4S8KJB1_DENBC|nr:hypothetical protein K435DRAFT_880528 [Dendrothele bispora CBS 962.96]
MAIFICRTTEPAPVAVVSGSPPQTALKAQTTTRRQVFVILGSQLPSRHSWILGGREQGLHTMAEALAT